MGLNPASSAKLLKLLFKTTCLKLDSFLLTTVFILTFTFCEGHIKYKTGLTCKNNPFIVYYKQIRIIKYLYYMEKEESNA